MRGRFRWTLAAGLWLGMLAAPAGAEKEPLSPKELRDTATHVVVGRVEQVFTRQEKRDQYVYTRYVAEVRVDGLEKGEGYKNGDLMYVRYWVRRWIGPGNQPPGTSGHDDFPTAGTTWRIYAARNAYDGFGDNMDGGFNVIGTNGFEAIKDAGAKPAK
jgi:hypothetical protein